jgi:hypothetical protein
MSDQSCRTSPYWVDGNFQRRLRYRSEILFCLRIADQHISLFGGIRHGSAYGVNAAADRFDRQQFAFKIRAVHHVEQRSAARNPFALPEFGFFQRDAIEMLPAVHRRASECRKGGSKHCDCSLIRPRCDQMPARIQQRGNFRSDMAPQRGIDFLEQQAGARFYVSADKAGGFRRGCLSGQSARVGVECDCFRSARVARFAEHDHGVQSALGAGYRTVGRTGEVVGDNHHRRLAVALPGPVSGETHLSLRRGRRRIQSYAAREVFAGVSELHWPCHRVLGESMSCRARSAFLSEHLRAVQP